MLNATHDPALASWVASANRPDADFPIQNLPFASLRRAGSTEPYRIAVAIGDQALDLRALQQTGLLRSAGLAACQTSTLNDFMALGKAEWSRLRADLSELLAAGSLQRGVLQACLLPLDAVEYGVPASVGDYTDFYTSIHHAANVGRLFRPDDPLLPNYRWLPIGYHGRSSSIVVSGTDFHRPVGQLKAADAEQPVVGACERLDYELEVGIFIGTGNPLGQPVTIEQAEDHVFGLCLLNDWSARDIQTWEYQPLGPFLAKSFATTISPWVVTLEALEPFRAPWSRPPDDPQPLPYLSSPQNRDSGAIDLQLEVRIRTERMRASGEEPVRLSQSNFTAAYWTVAQMVTHHTISGCNLQPGDLLGSGTMSGPSADSAGALLELSRGGRSPVALGNGEQRSFLEDGDEVVLSASCAREGYRRVGFGEARGTVLPARVP